MIVVLIGDAERSAGEQEPARDDVGGGRLGQVGRPRRPGRVAEPQEPEREQGRQRGQADRQDQDGDQDLGERDARAADRVHKESAVIIAAPP